MIRLQRILVSILILIQMETNAQADDIFSTINSSLGQIIKSLEHDSNISMNRMLTHSVSLLLACASITAERHSPKPALPTILAIDRSQLQDFGKPEKTRRTCTINRVRI